MIDIRDLMKNHSSLRVLDGVSLSVRRGEVAVVVGPSGGGKSTLLRCINGLETFQQGEVRVDDIVLRPNAAEAGRDEGLRQLRRRVGMVFQQFHLFPHLRVLDNVMSGPLWALGQPRGEAEMMARRLLERVGLADKIDAWPEQLSGGQQQRVGFARALAAGPAIMLLDEPFAALDPLIRDELRSEFLHIRRRLGLTAVMVTHDMTEALLSADLVAVMNAGRLLRIGTPHELLTDPGDEFVAALLSSPRRQAEQLESLVSGRAGVDV